MTKKETQMLNRERVKLADQHRGIKDMRRLPDAVVIVDAQYEDTAIKESKRLNIPVVAIVDSNTDPRKVDFPIPANDDSMRTIQLIISALANAVLETRNPDTKSEDIEVKENTKEQNSVETKENKVLKDDKMDEVVKELQKQSEEESKNLEDSNLEEE
tara:strand:- start:371 stop:844 length:474 start_codon:yes stop_codon:yes gene_type:complete